MVDDVAQGEKLGLECALPHELNPVAGLFCYPEIPIDHLHCGWGIDCLAFYINSLMGFFVRFLSVDFEAGFGFSTSGLPEQRAATELLKPSNNLF